MDKLRYEQRDEERGSDREDSEMRDLNGVEAKRCVHYVQVEYIANSHCSEVVDEVRQYNHK